MFYTMPTLAFLVAFGNELRRWFKHGSGGVDFGIALARCTLASVVFGLGWLGRLGDVSLAFGLSLLLLVLLTLHLAAVRPHPAVVRATSLACFALGLVLVTVDFTVNRCVGHSHSLLDSLLTREGENEKLAEEYVKWRQDHDRQLQHIASLTHDLRSTSKEFSAHLPLARGGSDAGPRRPNCAFSTLKNVVMMEESIIDRLYYQKDRVGEWHQARLYAVRSAVLANKQRIHDLNESIRAEKRALADFKAEIEFEAREQKRLSAPFWRDGSRMARQARNGRDSLAVVPAGSGLPPRRALFGVQRETQFLPRPAPRRIPSENNLPLHTLAREEPHRHPKLAPMQFAVARIDELWSYPPPVQYEQNPQEICEILHRDPAIPIMPQWQPAQVVMEAPDVEMSDAPALDIEDAHHGMELFQPAQVVGLQPVNLPVQTPIPAFHFGTAPAQPSPLRPPPIVAPASVGSTTNQPPTSTTTPASVFPQAAQKPAAPAVPQAIGAAGGKAPQMLVIGNWTSTPSGTTSSSFTPSAPSVPEPSSSSGLDGGPKKKKKAVIPSPAGGPPGPANRPSASVPQAYASAAPPRRGPTGFTMVTNNASASGGAAAAPAAAPTSFAFTQATFAPPSHPPGT
ncbi:hypothetical protein QBC39DRAFT_21525 [Podospora conica]|nr:hypothetical protein QBC39DRAFT_21525 [Schizothecium conicum]